MERHRFLDYMTGKEVYPTPILTRENKCSTIPDQERRDQVDAMDTVTMLANLRVYTPMLSINNDGEWRLEILTTTPHVFEGELDVVIRQAYETADTLEAV